MSTDNRSNLAKNMVEVDIEKKTSPLDTAFVTNMDKAPEEPQPEPPKDEAAAVSFYKLYAYATTWDLTCICIGAMGAVTTGLTTPANSFIFGDLVNSMVVKASSAQDSAEMAQLFMDEVMMFVIYSCALGIIMFVGTYISVLLFNHAANNQIYRIRHKYLRAVLNQDMAWFDLHQSGEFASRMNEDLTKLEDGIGEKVVMSIHLIVGCFGSLILALVKGWQLALVCMASLPISFVMIGVVAVITSRLAKREMDVYAKAGAIAEETFSSIRTVVSFNGQKKESDRYAQHLVDARAINIRKSFFGGLGFGLLWFCIYATYALSFWYGVTLVLEDRHLPAEEMRYDPGTMFVVFMSVMMAAASLGGLSPFIETFGVAKGAAAKVYQIIEQKSNIDPLAETGVIPADCDGKIELKNVFFNYPSRADVKVLDGISITVLKGETVALVGSSGCGKSTVVQLIQRFYDPDQGDVLLDNQNVRELNVNWLRSRIGAVGQEPVLFGTSIYENIRYGFEKATSEEIENAAKTANAHNFIMKLPQGYNTLVGEKGAQMSGGQKQRIAIARALVRNPDILLLDEATSALDTASEAKVQVALETASKGRTTIIVAHRLSTIRNADKIVVLNKGQVVEVGEHRELMRLKGHYHALVTLQIGSVEDDGDLSQNTSSHNPDTYDEDARDIDIIPEEDDKAAKLADKLSVWQVMKWNYPELTYIIIGSLCSILMGCAMPIFGLIFGEIIEVLSNPDDEVVRNETNMFSVYFVIAGVVTGVATFLQIWTYGIAGEHLTERVRASAFNSMLRQEIGWFDDKQNGTGTLCARLSTDAAAVQGATGQRIGTVLSALTTVVVGVAIGMAYSWNLGLVALAFTPLILIAHYIEIRLTDQANGGNSKALESSTKVAVEVVSNIRTVIALGRERMFYAKYMELLEPTLINARKLAHIRGAVFGVARSIFFFAFAACIAYGGHLVSEGSLSIAAVFVVTQSLIMGSISIANSLAYAPNFTKGLVAAGKIDELNKREPLVQDPKSAHSKEPWTAQGQVQFTDTEFFFPSRPSSKVLQGFNLEVHPGQTVALVGASGCGKSTSLQLLLRYYDPTNGTVALDGHQTKTVTLASLRSHIGIVSQEPSLFDRTIAENVAYGDTSREISREEIIEVAKQANIHNFVVSLPLGYDTRLGSKGTQLSGGQKQRIAIARALMRKPKVLLLDEATSALDMESEKIVQDALDAASQGRTSITIAHRLSTIVNSDVIFVVNEGRVVERGTHKDLLEQRGVYFKLYSLQTGNRKS